MTDSIKTYHPIDSTLTVDQHRAYGFPFEGQPPALRQEDLFNMTTGAIGAGEALAQLAQYTLPRWFDVAGPTGTFKVRGRQKDRSVPWLLAGYESSINVPACVIGQNVLLEMSVAACIELTTLLLQIWLLKMAADPRAAFAINAESAILGEVTLTNLIPCGTRRDALAAQVAFDTVVQVSTKTKRRAN